MMRAPTLCRPFKSSRKSFPRELMVVKVASSIISGSFPGDDEIDGNPVAFSDVNCSRNRPFR